MDVQERSSKGDGMGSGLAPQTKLGIFPPRFVWPRGDYIDLQSESSPLVINSLFNRSRRQDEQRRRSSSSRERTPPPPNSLSLLLLLAMSTSILSTTITAEDEVNLQLAYDQAIKSLKEGGVPIGSIVNTRLLSCLLPSSFPLHFLEPSSPTHACPLLYSSTTTPLRRSSRLDTTSEFRSALSPPSSNLHPILRLFPLFPSHRLYHALPPSSSSAYPPSSTVKSRELPDSLERRRARLWRPQPFSSIPRRRNTGELTRVSLLSLVSP